jgi:hypothetical protein
MYIFSREENFETYDLSKLIDYALIDFLESETTLYDLSQLIKALIDFIERETTLTAAVGFQKREINDKN